MTYMYAIIEFRENNSYTMLPDPFPRAYRGLGHETSRCGRVLASHPCVLCEHSVCIVSSGVCLLGLGVCLMLWACLLWLEVCLMWSGCISDVVFVVGC